MLTEDQIAHLEQRLLEERSQAVENLRRLARDIDAAERTTELSNIPTHPADRGSEIQEESIDVALAEQQAVRLRAIDDALERLREDPADFDVSAVSGRRIPYERLELLPWTRTLADEQSDATSPVASQPRTGDGPSRADPREP